MMSFEFETSRLKTLLPMYFSFVRTVRTDVVVQGRSRSVAIPCSFRRSAISRKLMSSSISQQKHAIDPSNFFLWPWHEDYAICLKALVLSRL